MSEPITTDIGLNPFRSDRRLFEGCVAATTGIKYGMVVAAHTAGPDTNARTVQLPATKGATGVRGVVSDQGNPNLSGQFDVGDEFGCCVDGFVEVLLDAGEIATKDAPAITGTTPGTVAAVAGAAPYDICGTFAQTYDNSAGANPVLVSMKVSIYRRFA